MKNFIYEISEVFGKTSIVIRTLDGTKVKEFQAKVNGLKLPCSGVVADGRHYPDQEFTYAKGVDYLYRRNIPKALSAIPSEISLKEGKVEIFVKNEYSKAAPITLSEVRDSRDNAESAWTLKTKFRQDGKDQIFLGGISGFKVSQFWETAYVANGHIWKTKPGAIAPNWLINLY